MSESEDDYSSDLPVPVEYVSGGGWARFTGIGADGARLVVTGAAFRGPDQVKVNGEPMYAVLVRTYRAGAADVLVFVAEDAMAVLVDETDPEIIRARATVPVYGYMSLHVEIRREQRGLRGRVVYSREEHIDVSDAQLRAWQDNPKVKVTSISAHRGHLPIPASVLHAAGVR